MKDASSGPSSSAVAEIPAEQVHVGDREPLRSAQHVVDLEKGLEQQRERDGHHRRIVAAGAQHRIDQDRADQRRHRAPGKKHEDVRHGRVRREHGRGVGADAEERGAAEVQDAGVAELDGEAEAGEDVQQHGRDHEKREVVAVEERRDREHPDAPRRRSAADRAGRARSAPGRASRAGRRPRPPPRRQAADPRPPSRFRPRGTRWRTR